LLLFQKSFPSWFLLFPSPFTFLNNYPRQQYLFLFYLIHQSLLAAVDFNLYLLNF
jgi:hypothetical protein